jgi:Cu/Ag efflux protein CusF
MTAFAGGDLTMQRLPVLTLTLLLAAATLIACGGDGHHDAGHSTDAADTPAPAPEERYIVRGEITAIDDEPGSSRLFLHHEAIPDFRSGGEVVGMDSMTMGFVVAPDVSRSGLAVGDKVEFEWVLGPDEPAGSIVRIDRLDPETELDFGDSAMPDAPGGDGAHEGHGS